MRDMINGINIHMYSFLDEVAQSIFGFDHSYHYSDDAGVWHTQSKKQKAIKAAFEAANFTKAEKEYIFNKVVEKFNELYTVSWDEANANNYRDLEKNSMLDLMGIVPEKR